MRSRKKATTLLLIFLFSLLFSLCPAYGENLNDLYRKQQETRNNINRFNQEIDQKENALANATKEVEKLDRQIMESNQKIAQLDSQLAQAVAQVEAASRRLAEAEKRLQERTEVLNKRIRAVYEDGNVTYLEVLLSAKDFTDFLTRLEFVRKIMEQDAKIIAQVKEEKKRVEEEKRFLEEKQGEIMAMRQEQERVRDYLAAQKAAKEAVMRTIEQDKKRLEQALEQEMQESRQLNELIRRLTAPKPTQVQVPSRGGSQVQVPYQGGAQGQVPYQGGTMAWPVPGYYNIPDGGEFGWRIHPILGTQKFHSGIDIAAPSGAGVVAANGGQVVYADWHRGYGLVVIVDHGGGITTLYAHLSYASVGVGQRVSRGQVIGGVGSTGMSTGPHLHFEVRINGQPVDPMGYLR